MCKRCRPISIWTSSRCPVRESSPVAVLAALAILACAPAADPPGTSAAPRAHRSSSVLAAEEIRTANADVGSAYDAIARLRPNWLTRGTRSFDPPTMELPVVFFDGRQHGAIDSLRNIDGNQIAEIRYYSSAEAGSRFGLQGGLSGVIEVTLKK